MYIVLELLADNKYRVKNLSFGGEETISYSQIISEWGEENLVFEVIGRNILDNPEQPLNTDYNVVLETLAPKDRAEIQRRLDLIMEVYKFFKIRTIEMISRKQINEFIQANKDNLPDRGASRGSIERYIKYFVISGGDPRALKSNSDRQGGAGKSRLGEVRDNIITTVFDKYRAIKARNSSFDDLMTDITNAIAVENRLRSKNEKLEIPDTSSIRRRLAKPENSTVLKRNLSKREQKNSGEVHTKEKATRPLEVVQLDSTSLPFFVVDEVDGMPLGRPYLTAGQDEATRMLCWYMNFGSGGYDESIMLMMQQLILPSPDYRELYETKNLYPVCGIPETVVTDQGRDFISKSMKQALTALGIIHDQNPAWRPWLKGIIERYFRTIATKLLKGNPGYTGTNPQMLGDYDPLKDAVVSYKAFMQIFHIFVVDIYPYTDHRGIDPIAKPKPIDVWNRKVEEYPPFMGNSARDVRMALRPIDERTIQRQGIEWEYDFYKGEGFLELFERYKGEKIIFKYDPENKNVIFVPYDKAPGGWIRWYSQRPEYTEGLSLHKHRLIKESLRATDDEVNPYYLAERKGVINEIIEREFYITKKIQRRSKLKNEIDKIRSEGLDSVLYKNEEDDFTDETSFDPVVVK
ncbi:MAG: hypothetical protein Crog4KO_36730 [Crocinitomicaceae bacterium]